MYYVLLYDYAPDVAERRGPYRAEHLALLKEMHDQGTMVMAGAWANPLDGAAIIFKGPDAGVAEGFVKRDPYVAHGLVTRWRVREWSVAVGG